MGIKKDELVDRAILLYLDNLSKYLELKQEMHDWDILSDEALLNFEKSLWKKAHSGSTYFQCAGIEISQYSGSETIKKQWVNNNFYSFSFSSESNRQEKTKKQDRGIRELNFECDW